MDFPLPQASQASKPGQKIFVYADSRPINVFVDSNGILENRPRLMRTLRNFGANICTDVSLANIIIVDGASDEGKRFVRDWGADTGKVILEVSWVRRCVDAGRALLENDAWGGCGNLEGAPPSDDEGTQSRVNGTVAQQTSTRPASSPMASSTVLSSMQTTSGRSTLHDAHQSSGQSGGLSQRLQSPTSAYLPQADVKSNIGQPSTLPVGIPSLQTSFDMTVAKQPPPFSPTPSIPPQALQILIQNPEFQALALNAWVNSAWMKQNMTNMAAMTSMQSMPQIHGIQNAFAPSSSVWPNQASLNEPYVQLSLGEQHSRPPVPFPSTSEPQTQASGSQSGWDSLIVPNIRASSSTEPPSQSIKFRSPSPLPISAIREPESENYASVLNQKGRKRSLSTNGRPFTKLPKHSMSPSPSASTSTSTSTTLQNVTDRPKKEKPRQTGIFTRPDGSPMKFFIQIQVLKRVELVHQIRKNGGDVVADLRDAKFIILAPGHGRITDNWMRSVVDLRRYALKPSFIEACLELGEIADEDYYKLPIPEKMRSVSQKAIDKGRDLSPEEDGTFSTAPSSPSSSRSKAPTASVDKAASVHGRSPTPPKGIGKILSGGRLSVTPEERAFLFKFARYLIRLKPDVSVQAIAMEVRRRVPTHPINTWLSICYKSSKKFEKIREEIIAELRGSTVANGSHEPSGAPMSNTVNSAFPEAAHTHKEIEIVGKEAQKQRQLDAAIHPSVEDIEKDMKAIVHFFTYPPEGVTDDEMLWRALDGTALCATSDSWQSFYSSHMEEVNSRLRKALNIPEEVSEGELPADHTQQEAIEQQGHATPEG